jgi:hypothetical protein
MSLESMGPSLAVEGATSTAVVFEAHGEKVLAPTLLRSAQVVVMDNLSTHKGDHVRRLVEERGGCELLYCPGLLLPRAGSYRGGLRQGLKDILGKAEARSGEALIEAMDGALEAITSRETRGFFEHCWYGAPGQPL